MLSVRHAPKTSLLRNIQNFTRLGWSFVLRALALRWKRVHAYGGRSSKPQLFAVLDRRTAGARAVAQVSGSLRTGDRESGLRAAGRHSLPHTSDVASNAGTRRLDWCIFPNPRAPNPRAHRRRQ